ncbi:MAG TPA: dienelactone hydrolase family protein [Acidimicrobiales bacterium]|nr:dienelactone hydrolase family protein [Acidimicrobiales bacterium]
MYTGLIAEEVRITGHGGDEINAYLARPLGPGPYPGVGVIHHMPGWDEATTEIARKFAAHGYMAIVPNLHYREGPDASPDDAAAASRAAGGVPDERFLGDLAGALAHLGTYAEFSGTKGVIGYCSGGRQAFLAALSLDIDAAVDCYGAFVVGEPPEGMPLKVTPLVQRAAELRCPLLGLFGNEDKFPSPEHVDELESELKKVGATYELHRYDGAGHGFFATDRAMYRPEAAVDGWKRIFDFYGRYLAGERA